MESKGTRVESIAPGTYEGYYWMSDATEPVVLDGQEWPTRLLEQHNPFVVEAQLVDKRNGKSYSIKYADGKPIILCYDTQSLPDDENIIFEGKRMGGRLLNFIRRWRPEPDDLCEGMEVLRPAEQIFVGFSNQ